MPIYQYRSKRIPLLFPAVHPPFFSRRLFSFLLSTFAYFQLLHCAPIRFRARNVRLASRISSVSRKTTFWLLRRQVFRRCPRSSPFSGFSILEEKDSYGRRWTCSVGRVFRPPRVETIWESEKASVDRG